MQTIIDLARDQNKELPTRNAAELENYVRVSPECRSLTDFLKTFEVFYDLLKIPSALERATAELVEDLAADNVIYAELRFAPVLNIPDNIRDTIDKFAAMKEAIYSVARGIDKGMEQVEGKTMQGMAVKPGIIVCTYRGFSIEEAEMAVTAAKEVNQDFTASGRKAPVVGIDLAGDESRYPAADFKKAFDLAHAENFPVTVHAAEAAGAQSAADAISILGAQRIGHGIRIREKPDLLQEVIAKNIPLEICLTSNLHTGTVSDITRHPFPDYYKGGVNVTINTDDPSISGITLSDEWDLAVSSFGLSQSDVHSISSHSIAAAFISNQERNELRSGIDAYFQ